MVTTKGLVGEIISVENLPQRVSMQLLEMVRLTKGIVR